MGWLTPKRPEGDDPRDRVGQNPTGRERKSSAGKRRKEVRKMDRGLDGTRWGKKK